MPEIIGSHVWYSPLYLNVAITNSCNLSCAMCFRNFMKYEKREMDFSTFGRIIEQLKTVRHINFCGIGEPLLHPNFFDMLELVRKKTNASISFSTNGTLFTDDIIRDLVELEVDKISVSVDGIGLIYEKIRNRSFDDLSRRLESFNAIKGKNKRPELEIEFVCLKENIEILTNMVDFAKRFKCNSLYLLHPLCLSPEGFEQHLHTQEQSLVKPILEKTEILCRESEIKLRKRSLEPNPTICYEPWYQVTITEDGTIKPCCFVGILYSKLAEYYFDIFFELNPDSFILGSISDGIKNVWKGEKYTDLRKNLLRFRNDEKGEVFTRKNYYDLRKNLNTLRDLDYCKVCQFRFQTAC